MMKLASKPKNEQPTAFNKALGLLSRREHSSRELAQKLKRSGYEGDSSEEAIGRLQDLDFQNDSRFAEVLVRSRVAQGYGPHRIQMELATHGLSREAVGVAMAATETDWNQTARELLQRKFGRKPATNQAERIKRAQFLMRRGFGAESIRFAAKIDADEVDCLDSVCE